MSYSNNVLKELHTYIARHLALEDLVDRPLNCRVQEICARHFHVLVHEGGSQRVATEQVLFTF